jgi:hypothetical protein
MLTLVKGEKINSECDHFYVFLNWITEDLLRLKCRYCSKLFKVSKDHYYFLESIERVERKFVPNDLRTW